MARREYFYNFPPNRRAGDWEEELKHASGEIVEACTALTTHDRTVEVLDAIECLEQALRGMTTAGTLSEAFHEHHGKNAARGDYD